MKNLNLIIGVLFLLLLFYCCKKEIRRFDVEDIILQDYPVLTDTVVIRQLIYNNPQISGWKEFLDSHGLSATDSTKVENREWLKRDYDDFFWERIDRDSLRKIVSILQSRFLTYLYIDSVTYRIIDTVKLKKNYGILILKADEEPYKYCKRLYLAVYNQEKENIKTYIIGDKYEVKGIWESHSEKINIYSDLHNERWLTTHFKATNYSYFHSSFQKALRFDSLYTCSIYDLDKHLLLKTDTINAKKRAKREGDEWDYVE